MPKTPRRPAKRSAKKSSARKSSTRKPAAKKASARNSGTSTLQSHVPTRGLYGWITHTELASSDPAATKEWCAKVLGWTFMPSFPMPGGGEYHLFAYSDKGGGGIRANNPPEVPGSIPYIHVADARAAFEKALREGAEEMFPPERVMEGVTIAIVRAPGGVPIGFSGP
jgi:predicted enzyme related to lactoylglutathione lyase